MLWPSFSNICVWEIMYFSGSLVWQIALRYPWALASIAMEEKPIRGVDKNCSKFRLLCNCHWEQTQCHYCQIIHNCFGCCVSKWTLEVVADFFSLHFYVDRPFTFYQKKFFSNTLTHLLNYWLNQESFKPIQTLKVLQLSAVDALNCSSHFTTTKSVPYLQYNAKKQNYLKIRKLR